MMSHPILPLRVSEQVKMSWTLTTQYAQAQEKCIYLFFVFPFFLKSQTTFCCTVSSTSAVPKEPLFSPRSLSPPFSFLPRPRTPFSPPSLLLPLLPPYTISPPPAPLPLLPSASLPPFLLAELQQFLQGSPGTVL